MFRSVILTRHAWREMRREKIPARMVVMTFEDPDDTRPSHHDDQREIRSRWFGEEGIEIVVDLLDGRVITLRRKGLKP